MLFDLSHLRGCQRPVVGLVLWQQLDGQVVQRQMNGLGFINTEVFGEASPQTNGFSFDPLTESALDAGIVCVGDGVTAVLWVEDED